MRRENSKCSTHSYLLPVSDKHIHLQTNLSSNCEKLLLQVYLQYIQ